MRLTLRQLQTPPPHPPVTMVRCMGLYNPQNPVRPSVRPSVRPPSAPPSYYPIGWVCVTLQPPNGVDGVFRVVGAHTPNRVEGGCRQLPGGQPHQFGYSF